ncbi:hypothetical protein ACEJ30_001234 [Klebsiella oxytoca]
MNIETVNELIQSLESAGELSIQEQKYLELAKEFKQLAAENVQARERHSFIRALAISILEHSGGRHDWRGAMEDASDLVKTVDEVYSNTPATDCIYAGIKASAIPEGFKLVPEQMYLSDEDIQAICMQCGNGDKKGYGNYEDGILWVGELSNNGEMKYGLNIANANYPEEGSITVFEFDEPLREGADK